ncbi:MAG: D-glycero-beta-D-manno-heptose 1,7-bisphosphate 7-phosphatase [Pseudomonadales bacterium]|nr:D-glycero-beta-D-manno-heptose 1,7-bisphosphate 7-phosphatase [Pseudomonadales bacterium]
MDRLLILDRDGVINEDSDAYIKSVDEWQPIPGSIESIAKLSNRGFKVVVATNQSGIGRGLFTLDELMAMHNKMKHLVSVAGGHIDGIFFCPHRPEDNCSCRKPLPGLLYEIQNAGFGTLSSATLIGDSLRDIEAALTAGCRAFLVKTGKGQEALNFLKQETPTRLNNISVFDSLAAAADFLLTEN